jgi:uncharacterized SAM-binding protein YcdF (DUF218 family)
MRRRPLNIFLLALGLLFLGTLLIALRITTFPRTITTGQFDCAIVLGAAVHGAAPSPVFEARLSHAVDLYQRGIVRHLVLTGGTGAGTSMAESAAGRAYALARGVPGTSILTEQTSHTTRQNLIEAGRLMQPAGLRSAVIVSDPYHLRRAVTMARDLGMDATSSATPTTRYQSLSTRTSFLLREIYFTLHYWLFRE